MRNKPNLAKAHDIKSNLTATKLKESQQISRTQNTQKRGVKDPNKLFREL